MPPEFINIKYFILLETFKTLECYGRYNQVPYLFETQNSHCVLKRGYFPCKAVKWRIGDFKYLCGKGYVGTNNLHKIACRTSRIRSNLHDTKRNGWQSRHRFNLGNEC